MNDDLPSGPPGYQPPPRPPQPEYVQPPPPVPGGPVAPQPSRQRSGIGGKVVYVLVMLAFGAAAVGLFMYFLSQRDKASMLKEDGVETTADVGEVFTTTRNDSVVSNELDLTFTPEGAPAPVTVDATDCTADRWTAGRSTVDVIYMPDDPEVVELSGCAGSGGPIFPAILGVAFAALALLMLRNMFRRRTQRARPTSSPGGPAVEPSTSARAQ